MKENISKKKSQLCNVTAKQFNCRAGILIFLITHQPRLPYHLFVLTHDRDSLHKTKYAVVSIHLPVHFQRQYLQMCNFLRDKKRKHCFSIMGSHNFSIQYPKSIFFKKLPHSGKNLPSEVLHLTALKHNFALSLLASLVSERKRWSDFFSHPQHNQSPLNRRHKS